MGVVVGRPRGRSGSRSSRSRSPLAGDDGGHDGGDEDGGDEQEEGNYTQDPTPSTSHSFTGVLLPYVPVVYR